MPYRYRLGISKDTTQKRHRRAIRLLWLFLSLLIAGILVFVWYVYQSDKNYKPESDITNASFQPLKTFRTPYFSFETDKSWKFIKGESTDKAFLYRSSRKNIIMRDLTVYVDRLPANLWLTYVLPVEPDGDRFEVGDVSNHCKDYLKARIKPGDNNPINATIESVRITCQIDGTSDTVGTGKKNGSYKISLSGSSGQTHDYYLLFHDLQFTPQLEEFSRITRSFRAK